MNKKTNHKVNQRHIFYRFIAVSLIIILYFLYTSWRYNSFHSGFLITLLTWSFFVFCTPIADAGFLLDFPIRLVTRIKMLYSEIFVWTFALIINIIALVFFPSIYNETILLRIFHKILTNPYPYWLIIILSAIGTYLSVIFGDEILDVTFERERKKYYKHKKKYTFIILAFVIAFTIFLYYHILEELNISFENNNINKTNSSLINNSRLRRKILNVNSSIKDKFLRCKEYWWFDDIHLSCQKKIFCGAFMYRSLRTFETKEECEEALKEILSKKI